MMMKVAGPIAAVALVTTGGPALGATLVASGFGSEIDLYNPAGASDRYRILIVTDAEVTAAELYRQFIVTHFNWAYPDGGWYKDYVLWLSEPLFWDPRVLTTYSVTSSGLRISADAPLPLDSAATPGEDYDVYDGELTQLYAFFDQPAEWKVYATPMPQPASWALLILGFGAAGTGLRLARQAGRTLRAL